MEILIFSEGMVEGWHFEPGVYNVFSEGDSLHEKTSELGVIRGSDF